MKNLKFGALLAFLLFAFTGSLQAQRYTITGIAPPVFSTALAINERGQVTGNVYTISANAEFEDGNSVALRSSEFKVESGINGNLPKRKNRRDF